MPRPSRPAIARSVMLAALAVGVVVAAVGSAGGAGTVPTGPPLSRVATVREFLRTVYVTRDAQDACQFLTVAQRRRLGGDRRCQGALARLGRDPAPSLSAVRLRGEDVVVPGRRGPVALRLDALPRYRHPVELAPASGWRIAAGVEDLLR